VILCNYSDDCISFLPLCNRVNNHQIHEGFKVKFDLGLWNNSLNYVCDSFYIFWGILHFVLGTVNWPQDWAHAVNCSTCSVLTTAILLLICFWDRVLLHLPELTSQLLTFSLPLQVAWITGVKWNTKFNLQLLSID
jgi:hypothetical protein